MKETRKVKRQHCSDFKSAVGSGVLLKCRTEGKEAVSHFSCV